MNFKTTMNTKHTCDKELIQQTSFSKNWNDLLLKYVQGFSWSTERIDQHQHLLW